MIFNSDLFEIIEKFLNINSIIILYQCNKPLGSIFKTSLIKYKCSLTPNQVLKKILVKYKLYCSVEVFLTTTQYIDYNVVNSYYLRYYHPLMDTYQINKEKELVFSKLDPSERKTFIKNNKSTFQMLIKSNPEENLDILHIWTSLLEEINHLSFKHKDI